MLAVPPLMVNVPLLAPALVSSAKLNDRLTLSTPVAVLFGVART